MSKASFPLRTSVLLCTSLLAVSPFAQAGEIKMLMKDMMLAMRGGCPYVIRQAVGADFGW